MRSQACDFGYGRICLLFNNMCFRPKLCARVWLLFRTDLFSLIIVYLPLHQRHTQPVLAIGDAGSEP